MPPKFLGICGMIASGKNLCSRYLSTEFGYKVIDFSTLVKEKTRNMNLAITRKNLQSVGILWRAAEGPDIIAREASKRADLLLRKDKSIYILFNSIRTIEEVMYLRKKYSKFKLIGLEASEKVRYNYSIRRKRENFDSNSFEKFLDHDKYEIDQFNINKTVKYADYVYLNEGSISDLHNFLKKVVLRQIY